MTRKIFGLLVSAVGFLSVSATYGEPFGALSAWQEPSSQFAAGGLLADPLLAHWLGTLPQAAVELETGPAVATSSELFDQRPIGGEGSTWPAATLPTSSAQNFEPDFAKQLFDATLLGAKPATFVRAAAQPLTVARSSEPRRALEGRSASRIHHARTHRAQRAKVAARRSPAGHCSCAPTSSSISERPISDTHDIFGPGLAFWPILF